MKTYINRILLSLIVISATLVTGCKDRDSTKAQFNDFSKQKEQGIYIDGKPALAFDEQKHQIVTSDDNLSFRLQTDDQSQYVHLEFSVAPSKSNKQSFTVKVHCFGVPGLSEGEYTGTVVSNTSQGYYRIWVDNSTLGFIVQ